MALRTARSLVVRGRPPGRAAGRTGAKKSPRRVRQIGVVESRAHPTVPLTRISALSRRTSTFQTPSKTTQGRKGTRFIAPLRVAFRRAKAFSPCGRRGPVSPHARRAAVSQRLQSHQASWLGLFLRQIRHAVVSAGLIPSMQATMKSETFSKRWITSERSLRFKYSATRITGL